MESASSSSLHPALLPPGTQVGPWRVVDWAGLQAPTSDAPSVS